MKLIEKKNDFTVSIIWLTISANIIKLMDTNGQQQPSPYWADRYKHLRWDQIDVPVTPDVTKQPLPSEEINYLRDRHNIRFETFLGAGDYGSVWVARVENSTLACKIIPLVNAAKPDEPQETVIDAANRMKNECEIMKEIDHPNIVNAKHVFYIGDTAGSTQFPLFHAFIFMEIFDQSLKDLISGGTPLTENASLLWFSQIADAVHYLHVQMNIVHQDIHWGNVLIKYRSENSDILIVKLADFGLALRQSDCGTTWKAFGKYGKSTKCDLNSYNDALKDDVLKLAKLLALSLVGWLKIRFDAAIDSISSDKHIVDISVAYKIHEDVVRLIWNMYSNSYAISDVCHWIYEREINKIK